MSQLFEPRAAGDDAWKRWSKEAGKLFARVWVSALPMSLAVGLAGGWLLSQSVFFLFAFLPLVLLWETMLVALAERAAEGKSVTVGDAWAALAQFWGRTDWSDGTGLKIRVVVATVVAAAMAVIVMAGLAVMSWVASAASPQAAAAVVEAPALSSLEQLGEWASWWGVVFLWGWALNRRLTLSCVNALVRKNGLTWGDADRMWAVGLSLNHKSLRVLSLACLALGAVIVFVPMVAVLVFPLEVFWSCLIAVVHRDIYEHKSALDTQEVAAKATASSPSLI